MPQPRKPKVKRKDRVPGVAWEMAFEAEVRQLTAREKLTYLRRMHAARLRALGRGPGRLFRVMKPTGGGWDLLA